MNEQCFCEWMSAYAKLTAHLTKRQLCWITVDDAFANDVFVDMLKIQLNSKKHFLEVHKQERKVSLDGNEIFR